MLFDDLDTTLPRHRGNPESTAAHESIKWKKAAARQIILRIIKEAGSHGITAKGIGRILGLPLNCFSGRCTELCAAGQIKRTGRRDEGCAVWVAIQ
jgi:hypothetical protein